MIAENTMAPELLKYALMLQIANSSTNLPGVSDWEMSFNVLKEIKLSSTVKSKDFNSKGVFKKLVNKFESDLERYPSIVQGHVSEVKEYFNKTVLELMEIKPDNIVFSFTNSDSLYFRVYKGMKRAHIEIFYYQEDEDDEIEFICNVYEYDKKVLALASSFQSGFNKLKNEMIIDTNTTFHFKEEEKLVLG